ncbi:MAG: hypothetical protein OXG72_08255, partial [Acidobacteria bacterium]|nr:hypothetical protein [Acidobacteriota bacterium]
MGDAQVHAGVVGQASPLQGVEAAEVDGIDERAGRVPRRDQPPARVLVGRCPHPDRRGVGEAGGHLRGSRHAPAPADPIAADGVERVAAVVLERVTQAVGIPVGSAPGVGEPAGQTGRRIAA